jgi:TonB-linked SusC/RagA family outer membrane protein
MLFGSLLVAAPVVAQEMRIIGKVTNEAGTPLAGVAVLIKGTILGARTNNTGDYALRASVGQVLQFRLIGHAPVERTVASDGVINVQLARTTTQLDATVVTALGQVTSQRSLGTSQQTVTGPAIAQSQRENFINALQGRVAGVEVTSSSGVPGASSSITIRGVSSISSSNQPLMIVDGLPIDNKTFNTNVLASDAPGSLTAFSNRGVDFTNRSSDLNPEDIETLVVLKGPEASALYGIDAANGAIVITTKRGRAGLGGLEYSNSFRMEATRARPELQQVYGPTTVTGGSLGLFQYFGAPYADGTTFYDNIDGFFQTAMTARHSLAFSGAAPDNRINYRLAASTDKQQGVVPNSQYGRITLTGASQAQVNRWLRSDLSMAYSFTNNDQPWKGTDGPLVGLLLWPQTDNAKDWLTPSGSRRRLTLLTSTAETDNPYFNVEKNRNSSKNSRVLANVGLVITPFNWGSLKTNIGVDGYTNELRLLRNPESAFGATYNGVLDESTDITRNINVQTVLNFDPRVVWGDLSLSGLVGNHVADFRTSTSAIKGQDFLDPNFVSVNNTVLRFNRTTLSRRRLVSLFGSMTAEYRNYLFVTVTGRNDWSSTIPTPRNSFFYPSVASSFVFTDAVSFMPSHMTGKIRIAYAGVGKDALPYRDKSALEYKTTSYGGYGYGFTGPNRNLSPEFAKSVEGGFELTFFDDRLGLDATWYRKRTLDQIVNDIRGSYATGFILFNLNGAVTSSYGTEITLRGTPYQNSDLDFSWDALLNFDHNYSYTKELPNALPESYVSDTWLYGNVRNGTMPGLSTRSLTGLFYLRNNNGDILIDPTSGLPLRSASFIDAGYDRTPDFTIGLMNTFRWKDVSLDFLLDIRKGGDVLNGTEHFLTSRGLSMRTLDREEPRIIPGVLRDGLENSATPTQNNIVVIPATQPAYYTAMSEELFIEKDVSWVRMKDITLRYQLPPTWLNAQQASVFITGTDLFVLTNYSGLDPIVNGNSAAVGGSGAAGIDYGNFPVPRAFAFGLSVRF